MQVKDHRGIQIRDNPPNEGFVYKRGSEADAGDFNPTRLDNALGFMVDRILAVMQANPTSDSPIESFLGAAIIMCFEKGGKSLTLSKEASDKASSLLLIPQFRWAIYRSDWAIYNPKTTGVLLIECDGKDYHSSDDQISHDMRKDQAAHDRGYLTMRFSGSKIHRAADACAKEIFDFVHGGKRG